MAKEDLENPFRHPGEPKRGQCVLYRNKWFKPADFPAEEITDALFATNVNQKSLEEICTRSRAASLRFKGMTAHDLAPIGHLNSLEALDITWAHKFTDVSPLRNLRRLKSLTISDNKRWHDLSQLEGITVSELDLSGGMWNTNRYETLEPIATMPNLELLALNNVKTDQGGLRPLAECKKLKRLQVTYGFSTEDYAFLSVKLPNTMCDAFAPFVKREAFGGKDCLVVGYRKPFLSSKKDAKRLERYVGEFVKLQEKFRETES